MISIEIAECKDASGIFEVERESFKSPWSEQMILSDLKNENTVYVIAKEGDRIVGYAGVWCVLGDCDITNVAVIPEFRRRGIADMLLKRLVFEAVKRNGESIRLEVRESNFGALALYEKHGFKRIDVRKKYYDNTEDAVIMELIPEGK